ncbi:hypothetical protein VTK56DRAFT_5656 [Thermocarpiscus australiensis]
MPSKKGKRPPVGSSTARARAAMAQNKFRSYSSVLPLLRASNEYSMRDEARNTASHQHSLAWAAGDAKLRHKPVTFVTAGFVEPLKDLKHVDSTDSVKGEETLGSDILESNGDNAEVVDAETAITQDLNSINGVKSIQHETSEPVLQDQVLEESNPPEEGKGKESDTNDLFFFDVKGDDTMLDTSIPPPIIPSPRSSSDESDSSEDVILFRGRSAITRGTVPQNDCARLGASAEPSALSVDSKPKASEVAPDKPPAQYITLPSRPLQQRPKSQHRHSPAAKATEDDDEAAILADYIANMTANSEDDFIGNQLKSFSAFRDLGGDDDAFNFGSEDDWVPKVDDSPDDDAAESVGSGTSDGEEDDSANGDDGGQDMDADMDDETLARLLAKQEELGIGSDELLIFDSSFAKSGVRNTQASRSARATAKHEGFDDLDWDQQIRQAGKRRRKQPPNFNVSDSEIEAALKTAWQRDRERKKNRKMEREALRAEGLLGKNADPNDLRVKYPSGMKLDDIKTELISFLLGSANRLDFPPLDKHARKILHEVANKFNIKSQSTGKGDQRRPVLHRTNRTVRYASTRVEEVTSHVEQATVRIHRKYFHRADVSGKRTSTPRTGAGGGRTGHKALTLREGEIVGASVPELGQENKGRAMLVKMGWSKGMALGAIENKGILEPVAQVMKRSKAGLG